MALVCLVPPCLVLPACLAGRAVGDDGLAQLHHCLQCVQCAWLHHAAVALSPSRLHHDCRKSGAPTSTCATPPSPSSTSGHRANQRRHPDLHPAGAALAAAAAAAQVREGGGLGRAGEGGLGRRREGAHTTGREGCGGPVPWHTGSSSAFRRRMRCLHTNSTSPPQSSCLCLSH